VLLGRLGSRVAAVIVESHKYAFVYYALQHPTDTNGVLQVPSLSCSCTLSLREGHTSRSQAWNTPERQYHKVLSRKSMLEELPWCLPGPRVRFDSDRLTFISYAYLA